MNHTEGNARCQERGGYLAEINDEEEFDFIINNVMNSLGDDDWHQWSRIGAKWSGTSDAGKWVFMTSGDDVTYTYTKPGHTLYQQEGLCMWLGRDYNSESGRYDGPWFMGSGQCSFWDDHPNLCEIPAAAGCDR